MMNQAFGNRYKPIEDSGTLVAFNAIAARKSVRELAFNVHAHPTLSEVLDEAYKRAG